MTDDFKDEIRSRAESDPVDATVSRLKEWGATSINVADIGVGADLDFNTPFPGNQPIRSSLTIDGGAVKESVIRYGVLSKSDLGGHPQPALPGEEQPREIVRLKRAVNAPVYPGSLRVGVDFGDAGRLPRPHVRVGFTGGVTVHEEVQGEPTPVADFIEWIISVGEEIRAEFDGEFVDTVPGMQNAPRFVADFIDAVSGQWDVVEAAPSSITNTEITFTEALQDATVELNEEGEVVRLSATFGTSPLAQEAPSEAEWRELVEDTDLPPEATAFVREQSGKREVRWDAARSGAELDRETAASALRTLSVFA
jgi:hypothetical protein